MDDSTWGLSPKQLFQILLIGTERPADKDVQDTGDSPADVLQHQLATPLPLDAKAVRSLPDTLERLCHELSTLADKPLGDVLLDPDTDLGVVKTLKEYGKNLGAGDCSESAYGAATAIYFAAIAAALVFHDSKITRHSYDYLARSFTTLADKDWVTPELSDLFAKACRICQGKSQQQNLGER